MKRIVWAGLLICLAGPVGIAQDKKPPQEEKGRLGGILQDVNLNDLTLAVQRITKKTFLWTEDLGLRNKRVHLVSDKPIADDPEVLFKAYLSILQVADMVLIPVGKEGEEIYKIKPSATGGKQAVPLLKGEFLPEDRFVTRVFVLKYSDPREVQAALINMASFPQSILSIPQAGILLATDYDYNIQRFDEIIKAMDVKKPDIEMKVIQLKNAIASDVEQMMNGLVQTLITRASGSQPAGRPGSVPGSMGQQEPVKVVADKRTNSVVLLCEPERMPQLEEIVSRLDSDTPFETSGIYIYHLRHTNAKEIAETLNAMYGAVGTGSTSGAARPGQPVGPAGVGGGTPIGSSMQNIPGVAAAPTIVADQRSNSVIIVTDRNTYKTLEQIMGRLDQRRPQVLIKATVVEIRTRDNFDLGVELNYLEAPREKITGAARSAFGLSSLVPDPTGGNNFQIVPDVTTNGLMLMTLKERFGNVGALLKALSEKAKVSILDEPEVATNDNGMAEMKVTNQVPVMQTTYAGGTVAGYQSFARFETAETTLTISPHISEGGYLRLETKVKIEKFAKESATPDLPPPKSSREISTKEIMVPNGATMVIGGIVTQDTSDAISGIPILADIPLLGAFFSRTTQTEEKRTLYIFLTPYILYDHMFGDYRDVTKERWDEISGLRGEALRRLSVDEHPGKLPDSTFQFQAPGSARKEE